MAGNFSRGVREEGGTAIAGFTFTRALIHSELRHESNLVSVSALEFRRCH